MNTSPNWSHEERKILEAESKGTKFISLPESELVKAGAAVCYQISKITGVLLPANAEKAGELHELVGKFIRNNVRFRLLTLHEIALASSWNAAGEFQNRVKHYNNELTLDYLGELLNEYWRHKAKFNLKEKLEQESMQFLPQLIEKDPFFWEKEIELRYQQFLKNRYNIGLWLPAMYNKLADLKLIPYSCFIKFLHQAYNRVIDEMNTELAELKSQGRATHKLFDKAAYVDEYKHSNHYVLALSKRLAVRSYFQYCNSLGMKNLFVEEK